MSELRALDDAAFGAAVAVPGVALVLFTASWCAPCVKALAETAALAGELAPRRERGVFHPGVVVVVADIDAAPDAAAFCDVRGVPSLVLFRNGERVGTKLGQYPRAVLRTWLDDLMGEK